jgi:hypothetical protein
MTPPIVLQVKFNFDVAMDEFERLSQEVAPVITQVPGLRWKLWLTDEAERIHRGVYLFEDEASVRAYLDGRVMDDPRRNPHMWNLEMKVYAIDEVQRSGACAASWAAKLPAGYSGVGISNGQGPTLGYDHWFRYARSAQDDAHHYARHQSRF